MTRRPAPCPRAPAAVVLALGALALAACASPALSAARRGDSAALGRAIAAEGRTGGPSANEARRLARAVAERELDAARAPEGLARVDALRACVGPLRSAFARRAERRDEVGARAAFVLVDEGLDDGASWRGAGGSRDAAWRAVAARSLTDRRRTTVVARRALLLDVDGRVREGAVRAAFDAPDIDDAWPLLEAARLDPEPEVRATAARAAAKIGGHDVVLALRDRWDDGDDALRSAVAVAWGEDPTYRDGGRDELLQVVSSEHGTAAVWAAYELTRGSADERGYGLASLASETASATTPDRVLAIRLAPIQDAPTRGAIARAAGDPDTSVRVAALSRLTADRWLRAKALGELTALANGKGPDARSARSALALAGDRRVARQLVADLGAASPTTRASAARDLAALGDDRGAAAALADPDASVRTAAACAILRAGP